ncbi:MAG: hypothetical protein B1H07_01165 [Campylobacteraceae bacterium 4484_166]|nr:MAG: hypothetical protein B1H07_01165 [Campylobacteraceae bacterium 4484_166]
MIKKLIFAVFLTIFLLSCEKKIKTDLHEVHWDRDMCELCKMIVSERNFAVQVVNTKNGKSYMFDDIGCAVQWFEEKNIAWSDQANIFITDATTGKFIDAKKAFYDVNSRTPMDFGFGAYEHKNSIKDKKTILNYEEVKLRILRGETMQNALIKKVNQ